VFRAFADEKVRRIEKLEIDALAVQRQLGAAEKKLGQYADENGALRAEMQKLQGQLARTRGAVETLDREKDQLQQLVDERAEAIAKGHSDRGQLMDKVRELQSTLAATQVRQKIYKCYYSEKAIKCS
jgi:regulator of replication initiation timing